MAKKLRGGDPPTPAAASPGRPSSLIDPRVVYCGLRRAQSSRDNLEQLAKLPGQCVDLIYIDPAPLSEVEAPFNSNRNYEVFWGETKERRAFEDRQPSMPNSQYKFRSEYSGLPWRSAIAS